jgi:hypothetical protein
VAVEVVNQLSVVMPSERSLRGPAPLPMVSTILSMEGGATNGLPLLVASSLASATRLRPDSLALAASLLSSSTSSGRPPEVYSPSAMRSR